MIEDSIRAILADEIRRAVPALVSAVVAAVRLEMDRKPDQWPTRRQAKEQLGCSEDSVDRMRRDGRLRWQKVGRSIRIDPASLRPPTDGEITRLAAEARS